MPDFLGNRFGILGPVLHIVANWFGGKTPNAVNANAEQFCRVWLVVQERLYIFDLDAFHSCTFASNVQTT